MGFLAVDIKLENGVQTYQNKVFLVAGRVFIFGRRMQVVEDIGRITTRDIGSEMLHAFA